ncbi:MAG: ABC transporter substrate-binding protein [Acidimicrobiales bacterium]|nr:ABC transporter substrate-binding protein [Acidimicrobiales bacterium]
MTRIRRTAVAALLVTSLAGAACSNNSNDKKDATTGKPSQGATASAAPELAIKTSVTDAKVGLIVSSGGPGADLKDLANGAHVAAFRLNGAKADGSNVELVVVDDNGTPEGATAAVTSLVDKGVAGIVYASTGEQLLAGAATAAQAGVAVVYPYADDPRVAEQGATSYLAGPTIAQAAAELAAHASKANFAKVALVRQAGAYGDAGKAGLVVAGMTFVSDTPITGDAVDGKAIAAGNPDAVIVWAESGPALTVADALSRAGFAGTMLFGDRAAVPAFGHGLAGSLAPAVTDGALSAGSWAGPELPTSSADAFFLAKKEAVSSGAVSADMSVADFRSHDAVLALVKAAEGGADRASVLDAIKSVSTSDVSGAIGAPVDFSDQLGFADNNVALLTYSNIQDGSGRYPTDVTAGGHWLAVTGTFTPPAALKGLDNPYGG